MALICTKVTTTVTQTVITPVEKWVSQQQKQCKKRKWPLNWLCWFVTVLIKVIVWITHYIVVATVHFSCIVVTGIIGLIILPFGAAIDAVCPICNAYHWINEWFITPTVITFVKKEDSVSKPGSFDYSFICNCKNKGKVPFIITAENDDEAAKLAKEKCESLCQ